MSKSININIPKEINCDDCGITTCRPEAVNTIAMGAQRAGRVFRNAKNEATYLLADVEIGLCVLKRRVNEPLINAVWLGVNGSVTSS